MKREDLRLTILGCFRYSLGRMTYMVSHSVNIIKENVDLFNEQDWKRFIEEIDSCDNLGMACDVRMWNELKEFAKEQIKDAKDGGKE